MILTTGNPIDYYWNIFPVRIVELFTIEVEPMLIDGKISKAILRLKN